MDKKFYEMQATIDAAQTYARNEQAVAMLKTDIGLAWMQRLRALISDIQERERSEIDRDISNWNHQVLINRIIYGATALVNLMLVLLVGWLISRDLKRRQRYAAELKEEIQVPHQRADGTVAAPAAGAGERKGRAGPRTA